MNHMGVGWVRGAKPICSRPSGFRGAQTVLREREANTTAMPARILVVDDYPVNVILLAEWLAREHYVVSTAADGFQALTIIEAEEPDIVLLDVMMPELDGFEVCKRIKSDPATEHIPVIM